MVPIEGLRFDRRSPRLSEVPEAVSQDQILDRLWREFALEELTASIATGGYFPHEPLIVEAEGEALVVIDGNRRLAAVRLLTDRALRERLNATDLPALPAPRLGDLQRLPVVVAQRADVWRSMGYRHVSGARPWRSYGEATFVAWAHEELGVPLDQVARGMGDSASAVRALYRALRVLRQAEDGGVFSVEDRWTSHFPFSHLVSALDGEGVRELLGLTGVSATVEGPVPEDRMRELGELCAWIFGSRSREMAPAVQAHDPDLRLLERAVRSPLALALLRQGQPLGAALDAEKDREGRFRELMLAARHRLQEARGNLPAHAVEQHELLRYVDDLDVLVHSIRDELLSGRSHSPTPPLTNL
ncbi:MAG TPA: ParB N-terminal domain-containing protein [Candidatus Dormibacteraeota bacterium]